MIKYALLAVIAAFALSACGQDDSNQGMSQEETASSGEMAGGGETASGDDKASEGGGTQQYFDAAAKVGEVRDSGLGYKYVVIEQSEDYNP